MSRHGGHFNLIDNARRAAGTAARLGCEGGARAGQAALTGEADGTPIASRFATMAS